MIVQGSSTQHPTGAIIDHLYDHLKKVSVPVFNGDKTTFCSWMAAFEACVDESTQPDTIKPLVLKDALCGELLRKIHHRVACL